MSENLVEKYSQLYGSPFLTGVFMGANAIKDVALFIDAPDCVFYKADMLYKTHDLYSELKQASIDTKLYFSGVMPNKMVRGYDDKIQRKLGFINDNPKFNLGVVTCMPVTGLLATQYNNIYGDFEKEFLFVPSFTDKFWIDGYGIFLKEIAKNIKIDKEKEKKKNSISLIGYLFDRNEGDCKGNIEEIKRIIGLMGIEINSIWLDGGNYKDLSKVDESELLVTLPYGKYASKILNRRLGTEVLEVDVPFGIKNTINFIKKIGEKLEIEESIINNIIDTEFNNIKEKIDLLDENRFLNMNYIYAGDPFLESSIKDIGNFLGMNHIKTYGYVGNKQARAEDYGNEVIDLIIGNSDFSFLGNEIKKVEFGFPSYNTHFLTNRPYMGFEGILNFVERLYSTLGEDKKMNL